MLFNFENNKSQFDNLIFLKQSIKFDKNLNRNWNKQNEKKWCECMWYGWHMWQIIHKIIRCGKLLDQNIFYSRCKQLKSCCTVHKLLTIIESNLQKHFLNCQINHFSSREKHFLRCMLTNIFYFQNIFACKLFNSFFWRC